MPARFAWIRQSDGETLCRPKWDARTFNSNGPSSNIPWSAVATKDLGPNWEHSANSSSNSLRRFASSRVSIRRSRATSS